MEVGLGPWAPILARTPNSGLSRATEPPRPARALQSPRASDKGLQSPGVGPNFLQFLKKQIF